MRKALGLAMVVISFTALRARATVYFQEDFESYTWGIDITDGLSATVGTWGVSSPVPSPSHVRVYNDPAGGGGQCMRIYDGSAEWLNVTAQFASQATEPLTIEYDLYFIYWGVTARSEMHVVGDTGNLTTTYLKYNANSTTGSATNVEDGGLSTEGLGTVPTDTWFHVTIDLPVLPQSGAFTFHQTINVGSTVIFDGDLQSFSNSGAEYLTGFMFSEQAVSNNIYHYVDNISITPEPATIGLLMAGSLLGMVRRKK
ncbi:MAG: PEP-CTERM sorting domain-containing protein [Phycisphaerae bacterium]|nr:PEP-CTERM sorting domain-containing protein [Phycisphaerae bacterium]